MLRLLRHLRVLRLEPGDVLVYRFQGRMDRAFVAGVQEQLEQAFPGTRAVVIDSGADLGVVRPPLPPTASAPQHAPGGTDTGAAASSKNRPSTDVPKGAPSAAASTRKQTED